MNETLSQSQAKAIVSGVNEIMTRCKNKIEAKNDDFIVKVSTIWEDKNAVDYFQKHKQSMESIIDNLSSNNRTFADAVESIANYYSSVGNIQPISVDRIVLVPNIHVDKIKEYFANSENSDDFGFVNPSSGAEQVMDAFHELSTAIKTIMQETVDEINKTNAFGNNQIKLELSRSAAKIMEIVKEQIDRIQKMITDHLDQTAQGYVKAGEAGITAAGGMTKDLPQDIQDEAREIADAIRDGKVGTHNPQEPNNVPWKSDPERFPRANPTDSMPEFRNPPIPGKDGRQSAPEVLPNPDADIDIL